MAVLVFSVRFTANPIRARCGVGVVTPLMLKELTDIPGKEMLMITVDYPPSIVMQVRGGKEVTLVPGQTFYEGPNDSRRNARTWCWPPSSLFVLATRM